MGDLDAATAEFGEAESRGFKSPEIFWDRALTYLVARDLEHGFREYEWRWQLPKSRPDTVTFRPGTESYSTAKCYWFTPNKALVMPFSS